MLLVVIWLVKITFEILFTIFYNFLTKYCTQQLQSTSQQSEIFMRINCQNVDISHKSHQRMNENIFNFDIALIMNIFRNGLRAGWASVLRLLIGLDVPGLGRSRLEKCQSVSTLN